MNNSNTNILTRGNVYVHEGIECVRWGANNFSHGQFTAEEFERLCGNPTSFLEEWAHNRYPLLCNGWLLSVFNSHVQDDGRVYAVTFLVNNAVCADLEFDHGIMTLASQNGVVTCEIHNLSV